MKRLSLLIALLLLMARPAPAPAQDPEDGVRLRNAMSILKVSASRAPAPLPEIAENPDARLGPADALLLLRRIPFFLPRVAARPGQQNAWPGETVYLDAQTQCAKQDCAGYLWSQDAGPGVLLSPGNTPVSTFDLPTNATAQSLGFTLTATDAFGQQGAATAQVSVLEMDADCAALATSAGALAVMDLSGQADAQQIHDELLAGDPGNGYEVFIRSPDNFMQWIRGFDTWPPSDIVTALHEANHQADSSITRECPPLYDEKYLFLGRIYKTEMNTFFRPTPNYGIVAETIDPALQETSRYDTYIVSAPNYSGNTLAVLLDELNAYTADARFQITWIESGQAQAAGWHGNHTFQIDGVVNFMVWLEYYLKSTRLNYPEKYAMILGMENLLVYIQDLWTQAEEALLDGYPYIMAEFGPRWIFFEHGKATGQDYLEAAYSEDLLAELDRLGIAHRAADAWQNNYFSYDPQADKASRPLELTPTPSGHWRIAP